MHWGSAIHRKRQRLKRSMSVSTRGPKLSITGYCSTRARAWYHFGTRILLISLFMVVKYFASRYQFARGSTVNYRQPSNRHFLEMSGMARSYLCGHCATRVYQNTRFGIAVILYNYNYKVYGRQQPHKTRSITENWYLVHYKYNKNRGPTRKIETVS